MEVVRKTNMKLRIETDKRTVEREFSNLSDVRVFMENFFSSLDLPERRSERSSLGYAGPERRMGNPDIETKVAKTATVKDLGQIPERNDNVKPRSQTGSRPERQFLICGGLGVFILIIIFTLCFKAHDKALRKDLSSIKHRAITLEERFPRLISELTGLKQYMSRFHGSQRFVTLRLDRLSQKIDRLAEKTALFAVDTEAASPAHKKSTSQTKGHYHNVCSGESLFRIAKEHGLSLDELCRLNQITAKAVIRPGQRLLVSSGVN